MAASAHGKSPASREIDELVALFTQGRSSEAETLARNMTQRFPTHWVGWKMLGVLFSQAGRIQEALVPMQKAVALLPHDAEAHNNLGITLQALGRLGESESSYRRALAINPGYAQAYCNLGTVLQDAGRPDAAEAAYRRALAINPGYAKAYNNLGAVLHDTGRPDASEACYRSALQADPGNVEAHNNLGIALGELGRLDEAEACCRRALQIAPDYADAHYSLGNVYAVSNRLDQAAACYLQALQLKPDLVNALDSLALLSAAQGDPAAALESIRRSMQIRETAESRNIFVACVRGLHLTQDDAVLRGELVRAMDEPWGRPAELAPVCLQVIQLGAHLKPLLQTVQNAWPRRLSQNELFGDRGLAAMESDRLLRSVLEATPVCDIGMERLLTLARYALLEQAAAAGDVQDAGSVFWSALARQCFINEYVFDCTGEESKRAQALCEALAAAMIANRPVPELWIFAVAAYFPLHTLDFAGQLLDMEWSESVKALLLQQVIEPREESGLRATIPSVTRIDDEVSLRVRDQYEENPYPRWVRLAPAGEARNIVSYLCRKFPAADFNREPKQGRVDILVAGCGTGQHSISAALRTQAADVLAIDLSLSSLAYARRKTLELGLGSVEYARADILELGSLQRSFDVIESSGVLHHLADPWAGWKVLLSLLRPGGFMKLGFYSEAARRDVVRIRSFIAEKNYGATAAQIRQCRQELAGLDASENFGAILSSPDFFSISACRDLLFHVQEHRMALPEIAAFLRENGLRFLGFDIDAEVIQAYRRRFPGDRAAVDLEQWHIFESEHGDTFSNMYQFWVQKAD